MVKNFNKQRIFKNIYCINYNHTADKARKVKITEPELVKPQSLNNTKKSGRDTGNARKLAGGKTGTWSVNALLLTSQRRHVGVTSQARVTSLSRV